MRIIILFFIINLIIIPVKAQEMLGIINSNYAGTNGITYGIDHYANSAPADVLEEIYGFTPEKLFKKIKSVYGNS